MRGGSIDAVEREESRADDTRRRPELRRHHDGFDHVKGGFPDARSDRGEKMLAQGSCGATHDDDHVGIERVGESAEHAAKPCSRLCSDVERAFMGRAIR